MAIDQNSYFKYQEHRATSGYGSAILVKEPGREKYSLLIASETVPSVFSSQDSFDFDLLNSPVKGKVAGKMSLEPKEVECLHHRDNVYRFLNLRGKILDFMLVNKEFVGYKFTGTIDYRANDVSADVYKGTYTITPMSADPVPELNVRDQVEETLCFASAIPEEIKSGDKVDLSAIQTEAVVSVEAFNIKADGSKGESIVLETSNLKQVTVTANGLIGITISATGYAPWTTTVFVVGA